MDNDFEHPQETGLVEEMPVLSLDVPDKELIENFKRWEEDARSYWDDPKGFDLANRRKKNMLYWRGIQLDEDKLYSYQIPYVQNELFVATETITAYTTSSNPSAEVCPEDDTPQSKVLAESLEWGLNVHSEKFKLKEKMEKVERSMYLKYVGAIKLYWDENIEDIVPKVIEPENIVVDKACRMGENPLFVCETCTATVQQIFNLFPEKKDAFMREIGRVRTSSKLESSVYAYKEIWFTEINDEGETECVAWYIGNLLLGKAKNPNFLYDGDGVQITNFLPRPMKPYVFFNYMNSGAHMIDETSPFEQAIPLQDALNKRGRQIMENADTANSILVLKSGAISTEEAENITRDPNQILVLQTQGDAPVNSAFGEITPHLLPNYVLNDKQDIKNAIHEIMGTPSQFRGAQDRGGAGTLGEARMMKEQAGGRQDKIIECLEAGLDTYYNLLVQMMKVWYKSPKKFACRDNDGKFVYVELSREKIPDVAWVHVEHGSTQKKDKNRDEQIAMNLAQMGLIDPYNLFKDLGMKNAEQRYDTLVKFKMSPDSLTTELRAEMQNRQAYIDFACIMNGEDVKGHDDVDAEHILAHRTQITTDKFLYAKPERQEAMIAHIQEEVYLLSQRVKLQEASMQGLLVDPNMPVTPQVPELPPQMPQQMPMQGGMPPQGAPMEQPQGGMMGAGSPGEMLMDQQMAQPAPGPMPMQPGTQAGGTLSGLLG
jgi:hypothetical protein